MSRQLSIAALLVLAACDAAPPPELRDAHMMAMGQADAMPTLGEGHDGCDYVEHHDDSNFATPEATALALAGAPITICGDAGGETDGDSFAFDAGAGGDALVRTYAPSGIDAWFGSVTDQDGQLRFGGHAWYRDDYQDHGAYLVHLVPGATAISADWTNAALPGGPSQGAPTVPFAYRMVVAPISLATLCPRVTAPADYTESHDGERNAGNDTTPETTGITLAAGATARIHGSLGPHALADGTADLDSFLVATGADADELAVRVDFADGTAAVAVHVTSVDQPAIDLGSALTCAELGQCAGATATAPLEGVYGVKHGLPYRVQIAAGATVTGPLDYDISISALHAPGR